jgi:hypothetical protein
MRKTKEQIKRSEAAKEGWEPRNKKKSNEINWETFAKKHGPVKVYTKSDVGYEEDKPTKPVGTITALSEANEGLSLSIGANLGSLLQRMRMRLHGSESQGTAEAGKDNPYSPSSIVGPLERTRDNQEANLKMLLDLESLLEEML